MASQKYNILYGRLSQEDERQRDDRQRESNSIHNQKLFLEQYAADHGFENTLFLADDGYSGTNFDRPAWKKIIEMVERDEVETIIVKDLSRLGREYLQDSVSNPIIQGTLLYHTTHCHLKPHQWRKFNQEV